MKYNHAYDFWFEVISDREDAADVTPEMIRKACIERIKRIDDQEVLEACNCSDTMELS